MQGLIAGSEKIADSEKAQIMLIFTRQNIDVNYEKILAELYKVNTVQGIQNAWDVLSHSPIPDSILIDVQNISGRSLALCKDLKSTPYFQHIPIIFLSPKGKQDLQSEAFSAGAADILDYPPQISDLLARLNHHIQQYHKTRRLESLIYIDPLTHLPNAAKFKDVMQQEWARCARYGHHMTLMLIRINHHKNEHVIQKNSDYYALTASIGEMLRYLAGRPGDIFASINENTFGLLLSDCAEEGAQMKSAQIMQKMEHSILHTSHQDLAHALTCTVAYTIAAPSSDSSYESIMSSTTELLMHSKEAGILSVARVLEKTSLAEDVKTTK